MVCAHVGLEHGGDSVAASAIDVSVCERTWEPFGEF